MAHFEQGFKDDLLVRDIRTKDVPFTEAQATRLARRFAFFEKRIAELEEKLKALSGVEPVRDPMEDLLNRRRV
jgi:hypothetical protein